MKSFPKAGWGRQFFLPSSRQVLPVPSLAASRAGPCLFWNSRAFIYVASAYPVFTLRHTQIASTVQMVSYQSLYCITPLYR